LTTLFEQLKQIIDISGKAVEAFRKQMDGNASTFCVRIIEKFIVLFAIITELGIDEIRDDFLLVINDVLSAQECEDEILIADIIEMRLIPFAVELQAKVIGSISPDEIDYLDKNLVTFNINSGLGNENISKTASAINNSEPLKGREYLV